MRDKKILNEAKQKMVNNILSNITLGEITILILEKAEEKAELELSKMNEAKIKEYLDIVESKPKAVLSRRKKVKRNAKEKSNFLTNFKNKIINFFKKEPTPPQKEKAVTNKKKAANKKTVLSKRR